MSAAKLLKYVKALSPAELQKFMRELAALKPRGRARPQPRARRITWPNVEIRALRNSGGRVLPNLVLAEREESAF